MTWYDPKQAAADPDNPAANEQIPFSEWNAMVAYLKDKIVDKTVNIAAIGNDKVLVYKTATSTFVFESQSTVAAIDDLTDVTISGVPADNEVLAYDTGTSEWINQTAAEAGLATVAGLASYLALAGGTMAGNLNMGDYLIDDVDDLQAHDVAGILFRNNSAASRITLATISNSFVAAAEASMGGYALTNVLDPTSAQHASTKNYDDTHLFTKEAVTSFTDGYTPVYRTLSGKFEMEAAGEAGAVLEADFDATTFLYATADNTPLPKTPAETLAILSGSAAAEFLFNTQNIGGIVDPTTAQQAATKNYADIHLFTKEIVTTFTDGYIPVYRTASGKFEMEAGGVSAGLPVADSTSIVKGSADGTKLLRLEVDGFTSGNTRVATFPDKNFTVCGTDEVMLLSGDNPMTADLDMGGYNITGADEIEAQLSTGKLELSGGTDLADPIIDLYGKDNPGGQKGNIIFRVPNVAENAPLVAATIVGLSDAPLFKIGYGLDMNDKVIADMKNSAPTALSGTQKDIEIDIGGTPYYFTVYPTKA